MSDIAALIAEARQFARAAYLQDSTVHSVIARLADALESLTASLSVSERSDATVTEVTAPAADDEREALADLVDSRIDDYKPRYDEAGRCVASNVADAALAAGFRRSARVPVSRDELRRIVLKQLERKDSIARAARSTVIVDALTATHDIFPKADRKSADSSNGDDRCAQCGCELKYPTAIHIVDCKSADSGEAGR